MTLCISGQQTRNLQSYTEQAFITPVMNYERENTSSFLVCSVLSVYPRPHIIWKMDSAFISESQTEEVEYLGPFSIRTILNITGSNSTYECTIENPLLKQTWTGRWTREGRPHRTSVYSAVSQGGAAGDESTGKKGRERKKFICGSVNSYWLHYLKQSFSILSIVSR
ncbi:HERV-H LTR-associating protein 2 [Fukomys damarensis]|uniref:HERV-H LTR-associating protein 2 n=1 Tax=Fukomys damarensis TaxID=885580 RepID=A0A091DJY8_FUKDA|nr:HERV-H LTR-associating protein 2 [Fukomys damarensis]